MFSLIWFLPVAYVGKRALRESNPTIAANYHYISRRNFCDILIEVVFGLIFRAEKVLSTVPRVVIMNFHHVSPPFPPRFKWFWPYKICEHSGCRISCSSVSRSWHGWWESFFPPSTHGMVSPRSSAPSFFAVLRGGSRARKRSNGGESLMSTTWGLGRAPMRSLHMLMHACHDLLDR